MDGERLPDDRADPSPRIERGVGVLEDDLHPPAERAERRLGEPRDVLAAEADLARRSARPGGGWCGRASSSRSPTRRRGRGSPGAPSERLTPSTARSHRAGRSQPPRRKCVRRSRVSRSGGAARRRPSRAPVEVTGGRDGPARPHGAAGIASSQTAMRSGHRSRNGQAAGGPVRTGMSPSSAATRRRADVGPQHLGQEPLRVGMGGRPEELAGGRGLDEAARVHHRDAVGEVGDDAEVVRDEERRHAALAPGALPGAAGSGPAWSRRARWSARRR